MRRNRYSHVDLIAMADIADLERGATVRTPNITAAFLFTLQPLFFIVTRAQVAGGRGYFLKGAGVQLNLALINYGISFLVGRKYVFASSGI